MDVIEGEMGLSIIHRPHKTLMSDQTQQDDFREGRGSEEASRTKTKLKVSAGKVPICGRGACLFPRCGRCLKLWRIFRIDL